MEVVLGEVAGREPERSACGVRGCEPVAARPPGPRSGGRTDGWSNVSELTWWLPGGTSRTRDAPKPEGVVSTDFVFVRSGVALGRPWF